VNTSPVSVAWNLLAAGVLLLTGCGANPATHPPFHTVGCGGKATLTTSGATSQAKAMDHFVDAFETACSSQTVEYTPNGSGAGIRDFIDGKTDFAGSDSPLSEQEYRDAHRRCGSPAWHLPVLFSPIGIAFNLKGVSSLRLNGPTAARIFNGAITAWNDPAIQTLNPSVTLPAEAIRVVFRSDESGPTDNFQHYLSLVSGGAWGKGGGRTFNGGVGIGAAGDDGVGTLVSATEGAIAYVTWSAAQWWALNTAKIITPASPDSVGISTISVAKTVTGATLTSQGNDLVVDTVSFYNPSQRGSYPIVMVTYEIVCSKYPDTQTGTAVKAFLQSATGAGQNGLREQGYLRIPHNFKPKLEDAVNSIA
jgi:phosphate transport system substrate-binding protein